MEKEKGKSDGKEFVEKLFIKQFNFRDISFRLSNAQVLKYRKLLNQIQGNTKLKEKLDRLLGWRRISNKQNRISFFQHQCLLRNPSVQHIKDPQIIEELSPEGFYNVYDKRARAVAELFNCEKGNQATVLHRDIEVIRTDKDNYVPVIYLRIDLRELDNKIVPLIQDLLNKKRKEYGVEKIGKVGETAEMALIIYDLHDAGLSPKDIRRFIMWTLNVNCTPEYVKEKLQYAKTLIKSSQSRNYPPKTTPKK